MSPIDVVVAVCTFRRPEELSLLLEHLQAQTFARNAPHVAVLVVDNSPDGEGREPAQRSTGPLIVHYLPHGAGNIASGRNAALDWVGDSAHFVAMIDDDEIPEPDWLHCLLAAQSTSGADVVTGPVLARYPDGSQAWLRRDEFYSVVGPDSGADVDEAVSGNALVSCRLVRRLGLRFDESLGVSGGEDQLFFRAARAGGGRLWFSPDARVHESVPVQRLDPRYLVRREYRKGNTLGLLDRSRPGWPAGSPRRRALASFYYVSSGALRVFTGLLRRDRGDAVSGAMRMARGAGMLSGLRGSTYAFYAVPPAPRPKVVLVADEDPYFQEAGHSQYLRGFLTHFAELGAQVVVVLTAPRLSFLARRGDGVVYRSPALRTWGGVQFVVSPSVLLKHLAWRAFRAAPQRAQRGVDKLRTMLRSRRNVDHRLGAWLDPAQTSDLARTLEQEKPEAVLFNGLFSAPVPLQVPSSVRAVVLLTQDVVSERAEQFRARGYRVSPAGFSEQHERTALGSFSTIVAIQWDDLAAYGRLAPHARIPVVPVAMHANVEMRDDVDQHRCLFVGSGSLHNVDGLRWFLIHCWADVRARVPEAELHVVGTVCARLDTVPAGVHLRGEVPDLAREYAKAAVALVPLRAGSGLKVKIVEAMCSGVPVVTTSVGAQGLGGLSPRPYVLADTAADFGAAVARVLADASLRATLERAARVVAPMFSPERAFVGLDEALRDAGVRLPPTGAV